MTKRHWVKFYGMNDMSLGWHLRETENIFREWDRYINTTDINTILELYNVNKFFDAEMQLNDWNDDQLNEYKAICKSIPGIIGRFCSAISDDNITSIYKIVEWNYLDDFWQIICDYKVYKLISTEVISEIMKNDEHTVWYIMGHHKLAISFGKIVADHLADNCYTAERLISHFLAEHKHEKRNLYFPSEFTQEMRDKVLDNYVECENANINYMQLLEQAQSTKEFPVSDKLKLKARKNRERLQGKLFAGNMGKIYGVQVTFKSIPDGSVEETFEGNTKSFGYSREWVEENQDYATLLNNFIYLFKYVDKFFRCTFVSRWSDLGILEREFGVKGKKDYITGVGFIEKSILSTLQMECYIKELRYLGIQLENIFQWFFEDYLTNEFAAQGFTYTPPSDRTTYAEKCKLIAIAIDGILKQYRLFCEDGFVDRELLEISSEQVVFGKLVSNVKNKYAYADSEDIRAEMNLLFSDQSMMHYTDKTESKYHTLPQMLLSEKMKKEDFANYQQDDLEWLIARGSVIVSEDGYLQVELRRVTVLKDLFENEVICPTYYGEVLRCYVETLVNAEDICYESTLFSRLEQHYLNYILNKAEFSNGLNLRNKYAHDSILLVEEVHREDYLKLQKIMALIVIKINEEFCIKQSMKETTS